MIVEREEAEALTAETQTPVSHAAGVHSIGGVGLKGVDDGYFFDDLVGIFGEVAILDEVGNKRMQAVDGDELFREIEGRAEVVDASIDAVGLGYVVMVGFAAEAEDARARRKDGIPLAGLLRRLEICRSSL